MAANTSIEWAANADGTPGATWNPIRAHYFNGRTTKHGFHCVHASEGCRFCYAETLNVAARFPGIGTGLAYTKQNEAKVTVYLDEERLAAPFRKRKPTTWFLSSMTDVFADFVSDADLDRLFAVMALCPKQTFIVVTKRSDRMRAYFAAITAGQRAAGELETCVPSRFADAACALTGDPCTDGWLEDQPWPLPNVWLVVSAEDQANFNARTEDLRNTPAAVRGVSIEPMLCPIDIGKAVGWQGESGFDPHAVRIDWVICGGESGRNARPMHPDWARSLRDQCAAASVPFFFKQWGAWEPRDQWSPVQLTSRGPRAERMVAIQRDGSQTPHDVNPDDVGGHRMAFVGKGASGRLLDGVEHNGRPSLQPRQGEARLLATAASPGRPA